MNDVNSLGMCHRALGIMYLDQKKWNKSQHHFKTAMSNHKKAEHRSAYEGTIVFLATAYYYEGQYDKAKEFITIFPDYEGILILDGGIKDTDLEEYKDLGVDIAVQGGAIFG